MPAIIVMQVLCELLGFFKLFHFTISYIVIEAICTIYLLNNCLLFNGCLQNDLTLRDSSNKNLQMAGSAFTDLASFLLRLWEIDF